MQQFGDWTVWGSVERYENGRLIAVACVRHRRLGLVQKHRFEGFRHSCVADAQVFVDGQLEGVTGVSQDATLKFR